MICSGDSHAKSVTAGARTCFSAGALCPGTGLDVDVAPLPRTAQCSGSTGARRSRGALHIKAQETAKRTAHEQHAHEPQQAECHAQNCNS